MSIALKLARTVNSTSTSFLTTTNQSAKPTVDEGTATGRAAIELVSANPDRPVQNPPTPSSIYIEPIGVGAENTTFSIRVIGWTWCGMGAATAFWRPRTLCEVSCTLGSQTGATGLLQDGDNKDVDTIALVGTSGNLNVSMEIVSPAGNTTAFFTTSLWGCHMVELLFDMTGATSGNAWIAF